MTELIRHPDTLWRTQILPAEWEEKEIPPVPDIILPWCEIPCGRNCSRCLGSHSHVIAFFKP